MDNKNVKLNYLKDLCRDTEKRNTFFSAREKLVNEILPILELKGFPVEDILDTPEFDLDKAFIEFSYKRATTKRDKSEIRVGVDTQLDFLNAILNKGTQDFNRSIYVFTGITDLQKVRFITFWLIIIDISSRLKDNKNILYPLWWYIKGGFEDKLRDDEDFKAQRSNISTLILDGLIHKSSSPRIEKFVDLIQMYPKADIYILGAGMTPLELCSEYLNISCNAPVYLSEGLITSL